MDLDSCISWIKRHAAGNSQNIRAEDTFTVTLIYTRHKSMLWKTGMGNLMLLY